MVNMKRVTLFAMFCFAVLANGSPVTRPDHHVTIRKAIIQMFPPIYTGQHDIVEISFPVNNLQQRNSLKLFIIEGDIQENGEVTKKILYLFKEEKTKKLLENAQCITTEFGQNENAFFGAKNGIYKFNPTKEEAEKYGTLTEDVISIAKQSKADILYIVNDKHELYNVTDCGTKKEKIDIVKDAKQVNIDEHGNLYILLVNKKLQVLRDGNLQDVTQLPENPKNIRMYKTMLEREEKSVLVVVDTENYMITAFDPATNGPTAKRMDYKYDVELTALGAELPVLKLLGFEKKIYQLDLVSLTMNVFGMLVQKQMEKKNKKNVV